MYLTQDEVNRIQFFETDIDKVDKVRELFLFQCFTGMAYIDTQQFSKEYVKEMHGYKVISSNRKKTDESYITIFLPEAERIAVKFNYNLPKISNQKYNDYLKLVAGYAELDKHLTSHVARHTFATYLLNRDVPGKSTEFDPLIPI